MTLTEMDNYLQLLLAETSSSSDFASQAQRWDMINEGCLIFAMETKIVRPATPYQTIPISGSGVSSYSLESTFLAITEGVFLHDLGGALVRELDAEEGGYKQFILNASSNAEPAKYTILGMAKVSDTTVPYQRIHIDPPPSGTYTLYSIRVYYAKQPLVLDAGSEISDIPVQFHRGPVCIAAALYKERDQEFDQAKYFWSKADYWMKRAKRESFGWDRRITSWRYAEGQYVDR